MIRVDIQTILKDPMLRKFLIKMGVDGILTMLKWERETIGAGWKDGKWNNVALPVCTDRSWTISQCAQAAHSILKGKEWSDIEIDIYASRGNNMAAHSTKKKRAV